MSDDFDRDFMNLVFTEMANDGLDVTEPVTADEVDPVVRAQIATLPTQEKFLSQFADLPIDALVVNELVMVTRSFGYLSAIPTDFLRSLFWDSDNISAALLKRMAELDTFGRANLVHHWTRCIIYLREFVSRKDLGEWE